MDKTKSLDSKTILFIGGIIRDTVVTQEVKGTSIHPWFDQRSTPPPLFHVFIVITAKR
jgi:hypothetical protein